MMASLDISKKTSVDVIDVHVGGDLHRIVVGGVCELEGSSVFEKMCYLRDNADGLRKFLLQEPRGGHPSLFADLVVTPSNSKADAGYIIMELMGYPLISGTNTMCTAIALLESGRIPMKDGVNKVLLEAPGGLVDVEANCELGKVRSITYQASQPSYIAERGLRVDVPGYGEIKFDIAWTGAFYPLIRAEDLSFDIKESEEQEIVSFSKAFVKKVREINLQPIHPDFGDEGPLSFVVLVSDPSVIDEGHFKRKVCCYEYPRNNVCRAPAGVPSTAAMVQLVDQGVISVGDNLKTISAFGSSLDVSLKEKTSYLGMDGYKVAVTGTGYITAYSKLSVDFNDPMTPNEGLDKILLKV
jgi:proline racemase